MKRRESSRFHGRQDGHSSSWRLFYEGLSNRRRMASSEAIESFGLYAGDVDIDRGRLEEPADDIRIFRRGPYSSKMILYGDRAGVEEVRLSSLDIQAYVDFLEETSQFFGDKITFNTVREVIFLPGAKAATDSEDVSVNWRGFTVPSIPGVMFINSSKIAGYDEVKEVLHHEFSHLLESPNLSDADSLLEASGWDIVSLDGSDASWRQTGGVVDSRYHQGGLGVSDFAKIRPRETIAELYSDYLGGDQIVSADSLVRDAMIGYLMKRSDRPLASSIKRRPIKIRRR